MNYNVPGTNYPSQLQIIAVIQTVIGILEIVGAVFGGLWVLIFGIATFGIGLILIPIPFLVLVIGVLSLISGIKGLNKNLSYGLAMGVAIPQMLMLLMCDVISFGFGLAALVMLLQQDVKAYFR